MSQVETREQIKIVFENRVNEISNAPSLISIRELLRDLSSYIAEYIDQERQITKDNKLNQRGSFKNGVVLKRVVQNDGNTVEYDKLVRDNIPTFLSDLGHAVDWYIVDGDELYRRLKLKVIEEFDEFCQNPSYEELADLEEVLESILFLKDRDGLI